ncbi:MAG: hypothetical protein WCP24_02840 [bacterium]
MEENKIRYYSLDEAREEIKKRWADVELKKKIEEELGADFISSFKYIDMPRSILFRQLISPDNGFNFFYQESKYIGLKPTVMEFLEDIFVSLNEEKKGYGRLRTKNGCIDIINFHDCEKIPLKDILTKDGKNLVEFHHNLIKESNLDVDIFDMSKWFKSFGKAKDYYYPFLLHCLAHGALFESFILDEDDKREYAFTKDVVFPAIKKIKEKFGLDPIIVKMYPDGQTEEEDLYWWSYPPCIDKSITKYLEINLN